MSKRQIQTHAYHIEQSNDTVPELDSAIHLAVITKAPEKYILIDTETGQTYRGSDTDNPYLPGYKIWKPI
jgi:hypothetical protein